MSRIITQEEVAHYECDICKRRTADNGGLINGLVEGTWTIVNVEIPLRQSVAVSDGAWTVDPPGATNRTRSDVCPECTARVLEWFPSLRRAAKKGG